MYGINLIHAGFLTAGLAVALPIIIHLLFRQKTRTLIIGSMRFLHEVVREHRRRRRVRQWLLLALRMLAVLLLALLFARPYRDESFRRGLQEELVLLIDRSASMQSRQGQGETSFSRALARARDELKRVDENVIVHVALCDAAKIQELPFKSNTGDPLATASPTDAATDYNLALAWASDVLAGSRRSRLRIVLLSDLQRTGLGRGTRAMLPHGVELVVVDVGEVLTRNVSIDAAQASRTEIRPDSPMALRVVVHNHGALPLRQVPIRCDLQGPHGNITASGQVDVPSQSSAVVDLPLDIKADGVYHGQVTATFDDALDIDNRRWVAFEARHPDRVLLVDGQEGRSIYTSETYFLETALRLRTEDSTGALRSFEPERIVWESGKGFPRLEGYRAIVLANVRRLSEEDGLRLEAYVQEGGRLLIFAGDQVSRASLAPLAKHTLLPGIVAAEPVEGRLRVDQWDSHHPALACFTDPQKGDLRRLQFSKILPLDSTVAGGRVLLESEGKIIAAQAIVGRGTCLYFGSTADRDWTDLPRTRMYVPLMRQLLAYLTDQLVERAVVTNRVLTKPDEKIGIEEHESGEPGEGWWVVTNLDPRESALERVAPDELQATLGVAATTTEDEARKAALALAIPPDALRPNELWSQLAWLLLFVLAAELLLASRVHA
jgi:hypothetical protein